VEFKVEVLVDLPGMFYVLEPSCRVSASTTVEVCHCLESPLSSLCNSCLASFLGLNCSLRLNYSDLCWHRCLSRASPTGCCRECRFLSLLGPNSSSDGV